MFYIFLKLHAFFKLTSVLAPSDKIRVGGPPSAVTLPTFQVALSKTCGTVNWYSHLVISRLWMRSLENMSISAHLLCKRAYKFGDRYSRQQDVMGVCREYQTIGVETPKSRVVRLR